MADKDRQSPTKQIRIDSASLEIINFHRSENGHVLHERSESDAVNYVLKQGMIALRLDKQKQGRPPGQERRRGVA